MDIEFIGYVIKLGNYYFGGRTQNSISIRKKPQQAEIYSDDELDIAERVASDLGGTIRKIYVSDKGNEDEQKREIRHCYLIIEDG